MYLKICSYLLFHQDHRDVFKQGIPLHMLFLYKHQESNLVYSKLTLIIVVTDVQLAAGFYLCPNMQRILTH